MKNDDQWQDRENELYKTERDRLKQIEKERAFLKDKSIGGNAPRPTDDFIDRSLGPQLNSREIAEQAGQKAERQVAQEQAAERRHEQKALKGVEQQQDGPRRKLSEQGQKKEQAAKREGQGARKLSEQSQGRKIEFKRGGRGR